MTQSIFEIRQQAKDLLTEALAIWRQSNQSENLEGIENDPVFSLMLTALAYQINDIDYDISRIKQEVIDEFNKQLIPHEMGHAIPATAVIETNLPKGIAGVKINDSSRFMLGNTNYTFVPLLETIVLGVEVTSIVRLDARRWKMSLGFKTPVRNLSGFSFAISNCSFKDVKITIGNKLVPLVKPWHYADLPLCKSFSLNTILYQQAPTFNAANIWFDLFARQNARIFCIKKHNPKTFINYEVESIDMVLEFSGIDSEFVFDKSCISLNTIVLINAIPHSVNLSSDSPIARVAGFQNDKDGEQFMHLIRPNDDQMYGNATVDIRRVTGDRFNQGSLFKLVNSLLAKFDTDYYAFLSLKDRNKERLMLQLRDGLQKLQKACAMGEEGSVAGTYLMLRKEEITANRNISLNVNYVTTHGAFVNDRLNDNSSFRVPGSLSVGATRLILSPVAGSNEVTDNKSRNSIARYCFVTNDRIVTQADMKMFCYNELMNRYSISSDMIEAINIRHVLQEERNNCGYEIWIEIQICDSPFIKRHFSEKIPQAELFIKKMIEVRSTSVYPIQVNIRINENTDNQ